MLTVTSSLPPELLAQALVRAGFNAVDVHAEGEDRFISGANPNRLDEVGGHALIAEEDREAVEAALSDLSSVQQKRQRVRELRSKPTMTQPEVNEAIALLLDLVLAEEP